MELNFWKSSKTRVPCSYGLLLGAIALALAGCAGTPSQPAQPAVDATTGQPIIEAGDIALAGQLVAHSINDLPEIASATKPPLVRFAGVTSAVAGPIDTSPYTNLLRDRLLLLTREKLRFVERELPPLTPHHVKHSRDVGGPISVDTDADYRITAQLRGNADSDTLLIWIQLVDLQSGQDSFSGLYRIRREMPGAAEGSPIEGQPAPSNPGIEPTNPMPPQSNLPPSGSDGSSGFQ